MVVDSISMFNHDFPLFGGKNHCFSMFFPMLSNLVSLSLGSRDLCPPGANFPISQPLGPLRTGGACWVSPPGFVQEWGLRDVIGFSFPK